MSKPLCFVLMPFGQKPVAGGATVDFDAVYRDLIAPAVAEAGLEPLRADEEQAGGIIHKPMFERLILCEHAVADLTTANANVFYELGLRHAVRPASTVLVFGKGSGQLPFDVAPLRALPYSIGADGKPAEAASDKDRLVERLRAARGAGTQSPDSPVFTLVQGFPDVDRLKTDVFRDQVRYSEEVKKRLATARKEGVAALQAIEDDLGALDDVEAGVVVDLFLSYRAVKAWDRVIALAARMPRPLAKTVMIQEQLALALNRAGRGDEAEAILLALIAARGPSSETYGLLGRVYKDRWEAAAKAGDAFLARGLLDKAIEAYRKGFEADWRDAYPGVNAVSLMELRQPRDPCADRLLPVVAYAVERRIAVGKPDYWDHATRLELAVLGRDEAGAAAALGDALAVLREGWEAETTARNLRLIRESRETRGDAPPWAREVEDVLARRFSSPT
jgi:tetratricopeptide (TPR) repeat protein